MAYAAAQLGVLVILTRHVDVEDVGLYALALAITAPVHITLGLRLRTARSVDATPGAGMAAYVRLAATTSVVAVAVSTALATAFLADARATAVVVAISLGKAVEALVDLAYGELQRTGRIARVALSQGARAVLTLVAGYAGVRVAGVLGLAVAVAAAWALQLALVDRRVLTGSRPHEPAAPTDRLRSQVAGLARHAAPLGVAAGIVSLTAFAPRYIVAGLLGEAALGIFSVLAYTTVAMTLVANSLGQALLGDLARTARQGRHEPARRAVLWAAGVVVVTGAAGTALLVLLGRPILDAAFGPVYGEQVTPAVVLMAAATVSGVATLGYYLLVSHGSYRQQPLLALAVSAVSLPAVYLLTASHGLLGVSLGMLAAYVLQLAFTLVLLERQHGSRRRRGRSAGR